MAQEPAPASLLLPLSSLPQTLHAAGEDCRVPGPSTMVRSRNPKGNEWASLGLHGTYGPGPQVLNSRSVGQGDGLVGRALPMRSPVPTRKPGMVHTQIPGLGVRGCRARIPEADPTV